MVFILISLPQIVIWVLSIPFYDHLSSRSCLLWPYLSHFYSLLLFILQSTSGLCHPPPSESFDVLKSYPWCSSLPVYLLYFLNFCVVSVPVSRNRVFLFSHFFQALEWTVSSWLCSQDRGLVKKKRERIENCQVKLPSLFISNLFSPACILKSLDWHEILCSSFLHQVSWKWCKIYLLNKEMNQIPSVFPFPIVLSRYWQGPDA